MCFHAWAFYYNRLNLIIIILRKKIILNFLLIISLRKPIITDDFIENTIQNTRTTFQRNIQLKYKKKKIYFKEVMTIKMSSE